MIAFQPWIREKTSRLYKAENIENLLDTSDVHVQYLSDNTDRWKQWMFKKKTWGNIHLEFVVSTSWKLESEGLSSCNIPLLCLKVILFYSKHIFNLILWAGKGTQIIFALESLRSLLWENDKW